MSSGLFGYLGYEMISHFENVKFNNKDVLQLPDSVFIRPSIMMIFDNVKDNLFIVKTVWPKKNLKPNLAFSQAKEQINSILNKLKGSISKKLYKTKSQLVKYKYDVKKGVSSNLNYTQFKNIVEKAKRYIYSGEVFQVVLSRYFKKKN